VFNLFIGFSCLPLHSNIKACDIALQAYSIMRRKKTVLRNIYTRHFFTRTWVVPEGWTDEWLFILPLVWQCFQNERNIRLICTGKVPNRICSAYHPLLFDSVGELRTRNYNGFWSNCFFPSLFRFLLSDALFRRVNGVVSFDKKKQHTRTSFRIKNSFLTESTVNENNVIYKDLFKIKFYIKRLF